AANAKINHAQARRLRDDMFGRLRPIWAASNAPDRARQSTMRSKFALPAKVPGSSQVRCPPPAQYDSGSQGKNACQAQNNRTCAEAFPASSGKSARYKPSRQMPRRKRYKNRSRVPLYIFRFEIERDVFMQAENGTDEIKDVATDEAGPCCIFASAGRFVGRFCIVL